MLEIKIKELSELKAANFNLENLSYTDGLTGISNRRNFDSYIEMSWNNCLNSNKPLSLIMMDIDYFKLYNDNYGHIKGDDCLKAVAKELSKSAKRTLDLSARYGGEEFVIILPETHKDGAEIIAEEIRKNIINLDIPHEYSPISKNVTLSLGVTTMVPNNQHTISEFINDADKALYEAKSLGRNRTCFVDNLN